MIFALALVQAADSSTDPGLAAANVYARCVGHEAVLDQVDRSVAIDDVLRKAFATCHARRDIASKAITASLQARGLDKAKANETAEALLRDNDRKMAAKLSEDISTYRQTGKIPTDAQNR